MCKFCDNLEYKDITIPNRTNMADDNVCEIASPDIENIDGKEYNCGSNCKDCYGCMDENNHFVVSSFDDNIDISYYHKIKDLTIAPVSARFSINFCPICGRRISKVYHEDLKFW